MVKEDGNWPTLQSPVDPWLIAAFSAGVVSTLASRRLYNAAFRRIANAEWVSAKDLERKRYIRGVVTSVGDADNFRLYHTPGWGWRWPLKLRIIPSSPKELKDETIHIRMCGVDAPEAAHFGREAQPYSVEALQWLKDTVEGRSVWCQLLKRDQYGRIVSVPYIAPFRLPSFRFLSTRCISIEMAKAGYATVYEQSGAEYGPYSKEKYMQAEMNAQSARRGMWASKKTLESPADYKKRQAASGKQ